VTLAQDDNVIQTFAADRTDQALNIWVLPGRSRGGDDLRDAHRSNAMAECRAIRFVAIPQQIARCRIPRKGLGHLARKPDLRRICADFEVNNPSAIKAEHNQGIKELERRGGDDKHINRRKVGQVVAQKAPPGRGGKPGSPRHPSSDRGLADLDAKLEQFPVDAGRSPQWVVLAHAADQSADFCADLRSSRTARSPSPVELEALAMPLDHGRRLDQYHRVNDLRPNPVEPHPQEPVERRKLRPTGPLSA
jgi:hypothetical protein